MKTKGEENFRKRKSDCPRYVMMHSCFVGLSLAFASLFVKKKNLEQAAV